MCHNECNIEHCEIGDLTHVSNSKRLTIVDGSDLRNCEEIMKGIYGNFINGKLIATGRKSFIFLLLNVYHIREMYGILDNVQVQSMYTVGRGTLSLTPGQNWGTHMGHVIH